MGRQKSKVGFKEYLRNRLVRGANMKVKELIQELGKLDENMEVLGYSEDEEIQGKDTGFRIFYINRLSVSEAERTRFDNNTPTLKFGKTNLSQSIVLLDITADF